MIFLLIRPTLNRITGKSEYRDSSSFPRFSSFHMCVVVETCLRSALGKSSMSSDVYLWIFVNVEPRFEIWFDFRIHVFLILNSINSCQPFLNFFRIFPPVVNFIFLGRINVNFFFCFFTEELRDHFGQYGEIESVSVKTDPQSGRSRGFAFIVFKDIESIEKVMAAGDHVINNKKVDPKKAKARHGKIFVGGLDVETKEEDIKNFFGQFGTVSTLMHTEKLHVRNYNDDSCSIVREYLSVRKNSLTWIISNVQIKRQKMLAEIK